MALHFRQAPLPPGVYHVLTDDGTDVTHWFAECAPWRDVAAAADQGSSVYAETFWQRVTTQAVEECARCARLRLLRQRVGRLLGVRSGRSSS